MTDSNVRSSDSRAVNPAPRIIVNESFIMLKEQAQHYECRACSSKTPLQNGTQARTTLKPSNEMASEHGHQNSNQNFEGKGSFHTVFKKGS